jgi:hypothetical protein
MNCEQEYGSIRQSAHHWDRATSIEAIVKDSTREQTMAHKRCTLYMVAETIADALKTWELLGKTLKMRGEDCINWVRN